MARGKKRRMEWSKALTLVVVILGFVVSQECVALIAYAIHRGFTATAAYLTAAVALAEAVIGAALNFYIGLAKSDHKRGGITYEAAKTKGFAEDGSGASPPI